MLDLQATPDRQRRQLGHRIPEGKRLELMNPLGKRFQVRDYPVDRPIREALAGFFFLHFDLFAQRVLKGTREARRSGGHSIAPAFLAHVCDEERQVTALDRLRALRRRYLELEILLDPPR